LLDILVFCVILKKGTTRQASCPTVSFSVFTDEAPPLGRRQGGAIFLFASSFSVYGEGAE